jgi:Peptidase family M28
MSRIRLYAVIFLSALWTAGLYPARADDQDDDDEVAAKKLDNEIVHLVNKVDAERIQDAVERLAGFGTRNSCSDTAGPNRGVTPARDYLFATLSQIKGLQVKLDPFTHGNCPSKPTFNVLAWLPGTTHPERLVIIGGHYDSRTINVFDITSDAPGANDSGAQTANVLEIARVMAQERHPDTLVFIAFSGEEQGLFGSGSIAKKIVNPAGTDLPDLFKTAKPVAMLNNDIPGGDNFTNGPVQLQQFRLYAAGTPREVGSLAPDGTADNTSPSRGLMRYVATWGMPYEPSMQALFKLRNDRPGRSSDQRSFTDNAVPAVRFIETMECSPSPFDNSGCTINSATGNCTATNPSPYASLPAGDPRRSCLLFDFLPSDVNKVGPIAHQHSPFDQAQFVTADYAARIAKIMIATASTLARAPLSPAWPTDGTGNIVPPSGNSTAGVSLSWTAPAGDDVHHFVIAARSTAENFYRQRVVTKKKETARVVTAAELGLSPGDSFFISVAAADEKGHESLFAYPEFRCDASACVIPAGALNVKASK